MFAEAAEIRALLDEARNRPLSPAAPATPGRAEVLIAELRAGSDKGGASYEMDDFAADVLIDAAIHDHPVGEPVYRLFAPAAHGDGATTAEIGSVLLVPEALSKPRREHADDEVAALTELLARIVLLPVDSDIAQLAASLGARHRLRAAAAMHLATAVAVGADRFITNNTRDFAEAITEIDVVTPAAAVQARGVLSWFTAASRSARKRTASTLGAPRSASMSTKRCRRSSVSSPPAHPGERAQSSRHGRAHAVSRHSRCEAPAASPFESPRHSRTRSDSGPDSPRPPRPPPLPRSRHPPHRPFLGTDCVQTPH